MEKKIIFTLIITFIFFWNSCDSVDPKEDNPLAGEYEGEFTITYNYDTDSAYTEHGHCYFIFKSSSEYQCWGDNFLLPPAGGGKYKIITDRSLILRDTVPHWAIISYDLVLNGEFVYKIKSDSLYLTQNDTTFVIFRELSFQKLE